MSFIIDYVIPSSGKELFLSSPVFFLKNTISFPLSDHLNHILICQNFYLFHLLQLFLLVYLWIEWVFYYIFLFYRSISPLKCTTFTIDFMQIIVHLVYDHVTLFMMKLSAFSYFIYSYCCWSLFLDIGYHTQNIWYIINYWYSAAESKVYFSFVKHFKNYCSARYENVIFRWNMSLKILCSSEHFSSMNFIALTKCVMKMYLSYLCMPTCHLL